MIRLPILLAALAGLLLLLNAAVMGIVRAAGPSTASYLLLSSNSVNRGTGSEFQILQADFDGSNARPLLAGGNPDAGGLPAGVNVIPSSLSPDGRYLIYTLIENGRWNQVRYNLRTNDHLQLTDGGRFVSGRFGPDGERILFVRDEFGVSEIGIMDLNGKHREYPLQSGQPQTSGVWHPDGERFVFQSIVDNVTAIYLHDLRTGKTSYLIDGYSPSVSIDGDWLYFARLPGNFVNIMRVPLDNPTLEPATIGSIRRLDSALAPSPDGDWLLFSSQTDIWRVPVAGGTPEIFINDPVRNLGHPTWAPLADEPLDGMVLQIVGMILFGVMLALLIVLPRRPQRGQARFRL